MVVNPGQDFIIIGRRNTAAHSEQIVHRDTVCVRKVWVPLRNTICRAELASIHQYQDCRCCKWLGNAGNAKRLVPSANFTRGKFGSSSDKGVLPPARRLNLNLNTGKVVLLEQSFELAIKLL